MIADFKKRLFCQLANIPLRDVDSNDPLWVSRIEALLSTRTSLPEPGSPNEYAAAFETVYRTDEERRAYIEKAIKKGSPSFGHRVVASLLTTKQIPCIFTTNFDPLVETSTILTDQLLEPSHRAHLTTAAIDNVERAELCLRESRWPLLAKLHGDYQSVDLKNTTEELKTQDARMRQLLSAACARFGFVLVGYSGRDTSIMEALKGTLSQPHAFPGGLYWVTRSADTLIPPVKELLESAANVGIAVGVVESQTFDELAADITNEIEFPKRLHDHIFQARPTPILVPAPLPSNENRKFPILQCSALPVVSLPGTARRITIDSPITTARAREILQEAKVWAIVASTGRELAAFGVDSDLERAFDSVGGRISGSIDLRPEQDSWAHGLIYDALVRALCRKRPLFAHLRRKGHSVMVHRGSDKDSKEKVARRQGQLAELKQAYSAPLVGIIPGIGYSYSEGAQIRLQHVNGRWWCAFEPFTYVEFPHSEDEIDNDESSTLSSFSPRFQGNSASDWRRERWATRYNRAWASIISAWARLLSGDGSSALFTLGLKAGAGLDAEFRLLPITAWSRPSHDHGYFQRARQ